MSRMNLPEGLRCIGRKVFLGYYWLGRITIPPSK